MSLEGFDAPKNRIFINSKKGTVKGGGVACKLLRWVPSADACAPGPCRCNPPQQF